MRAACHKDETHKEDGHDEIDHPAFRWNRLKADKMIAIQNLENRLNQRSSR